MVEKVQVTLKCGPIEGIEKETRLKTKYVSFQKIPYAKPPIGRLRFKDPEPVEPWTKTLDCTDQGPSCTQFNHVLAQIVGEEDCLHMNVYTKNLSQEKRVPVMVYIHGGAFTRGSSGTEFYGPDFLLQKDIVLVTFNYRLGAFGFLTLNDPQAEVPGNAGLKDQSLALKWVKENIQFFGGDPNNITLFGESAGAISVHFHMLSKMSKNLFHRAIVQSGTALRAIVPDNGYALRLARALGWDGKEGNAKEMVEFLRLQDHTKIASVQEKLISPEEFKDRIMFSFGPVVEPYVSKQCLIARDPKDMCRRAWSRSMPILIGGTSDEGLFSYRDAKERPEILAALKDEFTHMVPSELELNRADAKSVKFGQGLKELYFQDRDPSIDTILEYCMLMTDKLFWHGVHRTILSRMNSLERGATYVYRFAFDSPTFNHYRVLMAGKEVRGVCHADELSYIFSNNLESEAPGENTHEFKTMQRMIELWTSFATSGNPNNPQSEYLKGVKWEPLASTKTPYKVLNITEKLEVIELPEAKRMAFWDSMYESDQLY